MLGADPGTFSDEGASPDSFRMSKHCHALVRTLVTGIHVVALGQRDGRRAHKNRVQPDHGTGGVAKCTVDAHAELLVAVQLLRGLQKFALAERWLVFADEPWLHISQLDQEITQFRN